MYSVQLTQPQPDGGRGRVMVILNIIVILCTFYSVQLTRPQPGGGVDIIIVILNMVEYTYTVYIDAAPA